MASILTANRRFLILISAAFILVWASLALAHEQRPSIFTLNIQEGGQFFLTAETNLEALVTGIGPEHEDTSDAPNAQEYDALRLVQPEELENRFRTFATDWTDEIGLSFDGEPADLEVTAVYIPPVGDTGVARLSTVTLEGTVPAGAQMLQWAHPGRFGSSVLRIERPDQQVQAQFFAAGAQSAPIAIGIAEPRSGWQTFADYVVIGFTHILPKGLDHILFVLGLFFLSAKWRPLLWQVTAFTVAHSVTLALGLYGIVNLSPAIVEPLIALSIVYVAVENIVTRTLHVWRPVVVFLFGLLHGLGFAGILTEIGLPRADYVLGLVAFNVGVELGQLAVIVLALLAVGWALNKPWYRTRIAIPASVAIGAMGAWWFVERTMG